MARLASQEKAGFYPTPPTITDLILSHISAPQGGRVLDPCAGEGIALVTLAQALRLEAYGVELNQTRADMATELVNKLADRQEKLLIKDPHQQHLIAGDYRLLLKTKDSAYNLLYLNPPYDTDRDSGRLEYQWLKDARVWLQPGGLLVYVIPQKVLGYKKVARYLAGWYENISVFRFPDPEYAAFRQIVLFGYRYQRANSPELDKVERLIAVSKMGTELDALEKASKATYTLPKPIIPPNQFIFESRFIDPKKAAQQAREVGVRSGQAWSSHLAPNMSWLQPVTPLTPLKIGHLASILAAGFLDNNVLEDAESDERLLIKGHAYKKTVYRETSEEQADGKIKQTHTATEVLETNITTIEPDGTITPITGNELEEFLLRWTTQLTEIIANKYPPAYTFDYQSGPYATILDHHLSKGRRIPRTDKTGLLPAQKHAVAALCTHLNGHNNALLVGEMGCGKSTMGAAVAAVLNSPRTLIICPPHLVKKWKREALIVWPEVDVTILNAISDVNRFFALSLGQPRLAVISHSRAKLGSGWTHAVDAWSLAIPNDLPESEKTEKEVLAKKYQKARGVLCPDCGGVIKNKENLPMQLAEIKDLKRKMVCHSKVDEKYRRKRIGQGAYCGAPLYQFDRRRSKRQQPGSFAKYMQREKAIRQANEPLPAPKNDGYARWPLARYIRQHHAGKIDLLLADECHQFKSASSDQGMAFQDLVVASKKTLGMTGTIFGGKALSLFFMLYRISPEVRNAFTDREKEGKARIRWREWGELYGIEQEIQTSTIDPETGKLSGKERLNVRVKELPGSSPAMLPWLINRTVFISLRDLGYALPNYEEIPVTVEMSADMAMLYERLQTRLQLELAERLVNNDKSLLGAYLQALLCWVDSPWRPEVVIDPYTKDREHEGIKPRIIVKIPGLPSGQLFPKEKAIIDLILEHKKKGRRTLLFCQQTNKRDITGRWVKILADAGLQAAVLRVAPDKREEWVDRQVEQGVDVIITHPKRVETGMDLLQFPSIIWMGISYSIYTVMQASRRSWRIGQEKDVQVYFFNYNDTLQHDAMHLIAAKMAASVRVNGDLVQNDSLAELDELTNSDMITALANMVTKGNSATQSLSDAFASANHEFGMADRLIGGYQVTDEVPVGQKGEKEEQETTKIALVEEVLPEKEVDHKQIVAYANGQSTNGKVYQLSLLSHMQPVTMKGKNGEVNGYKNGHYKNGQENGHHQNGHKNGHANKNGHVVLDGDQKRSISPPQLEISLSIPNQVRSNKGRSGKRRRKVHRGPSLFDWLNANKEK